MVDVDVVPENNSKFASLPLKIGHKGESSSEPVGSIFRGKLLVSGR